MKPVTIENDRLVLVLLSGASLLFLVLHFVAPASGPVDVLLFYCIVILVQRLAAVYVHNFRAATLTRRTLYFVPLLVPFFLKRVTPPVGERGYGVLLGIVSGILLRGVQVKQLKLFMSKELAALLPPLTRDRFALNIYSYTILAIAQEVFYKGFVIAFLGPNWGLYAVLLASALFIFEHRLHYWGARSFDRVDYLLQATFSLFLGFLYFLTGSLLGCILGHLIYNLPSIVQDWLRYRHSTPTGFTSVASTTEAESK